MFPDAVLNVMFVINAMEIQKWSKDEERPTINVHQVKKTMLEMVSMNSPLQNSFPHWRVSLEAQCTSSICASPSFSSTLSSVWWPTSPNTSNNTMASQHLKPIFSWVSRLFWSNPWCLSCSNGLSGHALQSGACSEPVFHHRMARH